MIELDSPELLKAQEARCSCERCHSGYLLTITCWWLDKIENKPHTPAQELNYETWMASLKDSFDRYVDKKN